MCCFGDSKSSPACRRVGLLPGRRAGSRLFQISPTTWRYLRRHRRCGSRVWFWAQDRCRPAVDNSASASWLGPPSHLCRERSGSSLTANLDTWDNPPFASGLNTITPSRFHVPPRLLGAASHSTWTCPLDTSTFLHVVVCLRGIGDHRK